MENNWKLHHIGVAVRDIDKAVEYYQSLGIATFESEILLSESEILFKSSDLADFKVNGKTPDTIVKLRIRFVLVGSTQFELIQPVEGESPQKDFLNSRGDGINHIAYTVDDIDKETDKLVKKGIKAIFSGKSQIASFAYFDTRKVGNVIIELMQLRK